MTTFQSALEVKIADALATADKEKRRQIMEQAVQDQGSEVDGCRSVAVALFNAGAYRLALDF